MTSPFAHPSGLRGTLAGWVMVLTNRQRQVLDVLDVRAGHRVLEIGYGPGMLIRHLCSTPAEKIFGVDPSPEMRAQAARRARGAIRKGRVTLGIGSAEATGLPGESVDRVVAVNNVMMWPDLGAALREIHRVTRPGGRVVIAWHGPTARLRVARDLALSEEIRGRLEREIGETFGTVRRVELRDLTTFIASRE